MNAIGILCTTLVILMAVSIPVAVWKATHRHCPRCGLKWTDCRQELDRRHERNMARLFGGAR